MNAGLASALKSSIFFNGSVIVSQLGSWKNIFVCWNISNWDFLTAAVDIRNGAESWPSRNRSSSRRRWSKSSWSSLRGPSLSPSENFQGPESRKWYLPEKTIWRGEQKEAQYYKEKRFFVVFLKINKNCLIQKSHCCFHTHFTVKRRQFWSWITLY